MGPTAAGKTGIGLALADAAEVALVSVDSAMVYRHMDIGTAKPDPATLARYPHALIDVRDPADPFSAADFVAAADVAVERAFEQGRLPVLVGGTMMYFKAFRDGLSELPAADGATRRRIEQRAREVGWAALHEELVRVDPTAAERIHPNDPQRIQRALEVFHVSGKPISEWWSDAAGVGARERLAGTLVEVAVTHPREELGKRIERRFDAMLAQGFVDEVRGLRTAPGLSPEKPAMRAVGYRQVWRYLDGEIDRATMRDAGIAATRQLARRQMTWLRGWPGVAWVEGGAAIAARDILRHCRSAA